MNKDLKEALAYDALHEAEKLTGGSYKEAHVTSCTGMGLQLEQHKKTDELLEQNSDTNSWKQTLEEWLTVIKDLGFELVYSEPIPETKDVNYIFWHQEGVLLHMDSYSDNTTVNSAVAYFNYRGNYEGLDGCSYGMNRDGSWEGSVDAREALRYHLDLLRQHGKLVSPWSERPFLWLLHYTDSRVDGYDYKAINEALIAKLPEHVRAAITPVAVVEKEVTCT